MLSRFSAAPFAVLALLLSVQLEAATVQITSGVVTGVTGLNANSTSYDVLFQNGSCLSLYSPCASAADFAFGQVDALAAVTELGDLLAADIALFTRVTGCPNDQICDIITPYDRFLDSTLGYYNLRVDFRVGFDLISITDRPFPLGVSLDTTPDIFKSYAVWQEAAAVPVPAAAWLFGSALGLLGWMRRKTN